MSIECIVLPEGFINNNEMISNKYLGLKELYINIDEDDETEEMKRINLQTSISSFKKFSNTEGFKKLERIKLFIDYNLPLDQNLIQRTEYESDLLIILAQARHIREIVFLAAADSNFHDEDNFSN